MSEIEEQEISQIVEAGLEDILSGKSSMEDILYRHPDKAEQLRPELEIAMWLVSRRDQVKTRPGYVRASRKRIVDRIKQENHARAAKPALFGFSWPKRLALQSMVALVLLTILVLSGTGVVSASANTIPGDQLYPVKRFSERVEYQIAFSPEPRVELSIRNAGRRLTEADVLIRMGRVAEAHQTLEEYQQEIKRAADQLQLVSDKNVARKAQLARTLQTSLANQTEQINSIIASAPPSMQADLQQSLETTSATADVVLEVVVEMEILEAATSTPGAAPTGVQATDAVAPTVGVGTQYPGAVGTPRPGSGTPSYVTTESPAQDDPTLSPVPATPINPDDPKIERTPKEPNPNKPETKPEKPTEQTKPDRPGGSGSSPPDDTGDPGKNPEKTK